MKRLPLAARGATNVGADRRDRARTSTTRSPRPENSRNHRFHVEDFPVQARDECGEQAWWAGSRSTRTALVGFLSKRIFLPPSSMQSRSSSERFGESEKRTRNQSHPVPAEGEGR